jgi:hypothetical protein
MNAMIALSLALSGPANAPAPEPLSSGSVSAPLFGRTLVGMPPRVRYILHETEDIRVSAGCTLGLFPLGPVFLGQCEYYIGRGFGLRVGATVSGAGVGLPVELVRYGFLPWPGTFGELDVALRLDLPRMRLFLVPSLEL